MTTREAISSNNLDNQNVSLVKEHQEKQIVAVTPINSSNVMIVKKKTFKSSEHFKCHKCSQVSCTMKELRKHTLRKHPTFKCSRCDKSYLGTEPMLEDKKFKRTCHSCHKKFSEVSIVKRHVLTEHELTNRNHCVQCNKSFACKLSLEDHVLKKHNVAGLEFNCELCNKSFDDPLNYSNHKRSHRPVLAVKCEYCEISFNKKCNLNRHLSEVHGYETRLNMYLENTRIQLPIQMQGV